MGACLCMWHLMACSCNVDCLSFHNIKQGFSDSIVFKYDETKMDKTGEYVQEKIILQSFSGPSLFLYCLGALSLPSMGTLG